MRKTTEYIINDKDNKKNRDNGKVFLIEEMPAYIAERWCYKALSGMIQGGLDVSLVANAIEFASEIMALLSLANFFRIDEATQNQLLDELMKYITIIPDNGKGKPRKLIAGTQDSDDIQEASTLMELKLEALELNLNFLKVVGSQVLNRYFTKPNQKK